MNQDTNKIDCYQGKFFKGYAPHFYLRTADHFNYEDKRNQWIICKHCGNITSGCEHCLQAK